MPYDRHNNTHSQICGMHKMQIFFTHVYIMILFSNDFNVTVKFLQAYLFVLFFASVPFLDRELHTEFLLKGLKNLSVSYEVKNQWH